MFYKHIIIYNYIQVLKIIYKMSVSDELFCEIFALPNDFLSLSEEIPCTYRHTTKKTQREHFEYVFANTKFEDEDFIFFLDDDDLFLHPVYLREAVLSSQFLPHSEELHDI